MPLLCAASTTKTPIEIPLTILFLSKKLADLGFTLGSYSVITNPSFSNIFLYKLLFLAGKI